MALEGPSLCILVYSTDVCLWKYLQYEHTFIVRPARKRLQSSLECRYTYRCQYLTVGVVWMSLTRDVPLLVFYWHPVAVFTCMCVCEERWLFYWFQSKHGEGEILRCCCLSNTPF